MMKIKTIVRPDGKFIKIIDVIAWLEQAKQDIGNIQTKGYVNQQLRELNKLNNAK